VQQRLGIARGQPSPLFRDADGHNLVLIFIDRLNYGRGREQGYFMLSASPAEQYSYSQFLHGFVSVDASRARVKPRGVNF
jgi:hypothetical protein